MSRPDLLDIDSPYTLESHYSSIWPDSSMRALLSFMLPNQLCSTTHYRSDIDGLRALAVLAVIAYHASPSRLSGGFIGVDIFFVISGYLIAKIIYPEILQGTFTITGFYARRIKRLFPALISVTLATFLIGFYFLPPKDFISLGSHMAGSSVFLQNIVLLSQIGYFDINAARKPLLHLWSLGIEEQYYIVWPLLLLLITKRKLNAITLSTSLALLSFILCISIGKHHIDQSFYLPFTRAWELLLGAILAIWTLSMKDSPVFQWPALYVEPLLQKMMWSTPPASKSYLRHNVAATLALAAIAYAMYHFNSQFHAYPGYKTLVPVIATIFLLLSSEAWINRRLLSASPVVMIGLISYPLYLWHYPLMAYAHIFLSEPVAKPVRIGLIVLSFVLAWLTYTCIEKPLRFGKKSRLKIIVLLTGMAVIGAMGAFIVSSKGLPERIPEHIRPFMLTGDETSKYWRREKCLLLPDQTYADFAAECAGSHPERPQIFIWGDSYAAAFYAGFSRLKLIKDHYNVAEYTASACPPIVGFVQPERPHCTKINDTVMGKISAIRPNTVILHASWPQDAGNNIANLRATILKLKALHIPNIVLLGQVPSWGDDGLADVVVNYYYKGGLFQPHQVLPKRTLYHSGFESEKALEAVLRNVAKTTGIKYVAPLDIMCNEKGCLARIGKNGSQLTAFDPGHLTLPGSLYLGKRALPKILA